MPAADLIAKLLLVTLFFWSGAINKPANFAAIAAILKEKGVPMAPFALLLAILLEIGGAIAIVLADFLPRTIVYSAVGLLIAYSLLTAVMFHNFWRLQGPARDHDLASFLKNIGLCGGFLLVAIHV